MADRILYANAIEYVRVVHHNLVSNALARRTSFVILPTIYQRAYLLTHGTGEIPVTEDFVAPDESLTVGRDARVKIISQK
jgi:hypothetical protein